MNKNRERGRETDYGQIEKAEKQQVLQEFEGKES